ncbi:MAG: hypothetical protein KF787_12680 [Phycisphaeraceae bacterium]|nr:hypothetical protein [Phycisphaeraceae bacterium]
MPSESDMARRLEIEKNNLHFWRRSDMPLMWVMRHPQGWNHDDWLGLLDELKKTRHWPMNEAEIGRTIESLRRFEVASNASPAVLYARLRKNLDSWWYGWHSESWDDQAMTAELTTRDYIEDSDSWKDLGELLAKAAWHIFVRHGHSSRRRHSMTDRRVTIRCTIQVAANPTRVVLKFMEANEIKWQATKKKVATSLLPDILDLC